DLKLRSAGSPDARPSRAGKSADLLADRKPARKGNDLSTVPDPSSAAPADRAPKPGSSSRRGSTSHTSTPECAPNPSSRPRGARNPRGWRRGVDPAAQLELVFR